MWSLLPRYLNLSIPTTSGTQHEFTPSHILRCTPTSNNLKRKQTDAAIVTASYSTLFSSATLSVLTLDEKSNYESCLLPSERLTLKLQKAIKFFCSYFFPQENRFSLPSLRLCRDFIELVRYNLIGLVPMLCK